MLERVGSLHDLDNYSGLTYCTGQKHSAINHCSVHCASSENHFCRLRSPKERDRSGSTGIDRDRHGSIRIDADRRGSTGAVDPRRSVSIPMYCRQQTTAIEVDTDRSGSTASVDPCRSVSIRVDPYPCRSRSIPTDFNTRAQAMQYAQPFLLYGAVPSFSLRSCTPGHRHHNLENKNPVEAKAPGTQRHDLGAKAPSGSKSSLEKQKPLREPTHRYLWLAASKHNRFCSPTAPGVNFIGTKRIRAQRQLAQAHATPALNAASR